ncbi:hypothetical protein HRbin02_01623 [Candidatus Calditenuaceae archaeon HR02]|nr:hypothetical protein HRbin02_01623 [Candidatus Calditenuaceae archaeon HR02]
MALVGRSDGVTEFVVMNDMRKAVDEISSSASRDCVIITYEYKVYNRLDLIGISHLRIRRPERYAEGIAHINHCKNRQLFLRILLRRMRFRGVSKRYLQEYLSFPPLLNNRPSDWFSHPTIPDDLKMSVGSLFPARGSSRLPCCGIQMSSL